MNYDDFVNNFGEDEMKINKITGTKWEIWHQDHFDPNTPRKVVLAGDELIDGLTELWIRHFCETLRRDGYIGFSIYNLWLVKSRQSIEVVGDLAGQKKLRKWIIRDYWDYSPDCKDAVDKNLLDIIVKAHLCLLEAGGTSEIIFEKVNKSDNRHQFEKLLEKV